MNYGHFSFYSIHKKCLVIIEIIKIKSILSVEPENNPPILFNHKTPITFQASFQRMNFPTAKELKILWYQLCTVNYFEHLLNSVKLISRQFTCSSGFP